jgi:hypothetical protein
VERTYVLQHAEQQAQRVYEGPSVWAAMPARDVQIAPPTPFVRHLDRSERQLPADGRQQSSQRSAARHEPHEVPAEVRDMRVLDAVKHLLGLGWRNMDVARALGVECTYVNGVKQAIKRRQQRLDSRDSA